MKNFLLKVSSVHASSNMTIRELIAQVNAGEGERLEFKKKVAFPEKIVREIVAFANTNGGDLFIGVDDDGSISGLKFADEDQYELEKAIRSYCKPMIKYKSEIIPVSKKKSVIRYTIFESVRKPHYVIENSEATRKAYVRVRDRSIQASREIREILKRSRKNKDIKFTYGEKETILMQYLEKNAHITVKRFAEISGLPKRIASQTLILLALANVLRVIPREVEDYFELKKYGVKE